MIDVTTFFVSVTKRTATDVKWDAIQCSTQSHVMSWSWMWMITIKQKIIMLLLAVLPPTTTKCEMKRRLIKSILGISSPITYHVWWCEKFHEHESILQPSTLMDAKLNSLLIAIAAFSLSCKQKYVSEEKEGWKLRPNTQVRKKERCFVCKGIIGN